MIMHDFFSALEHSTTRCDSIASNRFPRSIGPLPLPWRNYGDSLYYYADCRKNATGEYTSANWIRFWLEELELVIRLGHCNQETKYPL